MNTIAGACARARANTSRTRDAPIPTYNSTNSLAATEMKGTPASPATARANRVFPVPGEPHKSTPHGGLAPSLEYRSGFFKMSTISESSSFASSTPATSSNVVDGGGVKFGSLRPRPLNDLPPTCLPAPGIPPGMPPPGIPPLPPGIPPPDPIIIEFSRKFLNQKNKTIDAKTKNGKSNAFLSPSASTEKSSTSFFSNCAYGVCASAGFLVA
mmetsp:Transcript_8134/g.25703  ORF Transcript_8134/g.25703 Transcript_8134/m.25703 type:complete len:212 (-) Transcript_8134:493-1128(-)